MSADVAMSDFQLDAPQAAVVGAVVTATLAWLGNRLVGKAAIQTAVNATFRELMDQMRQELRVALNERDKARGRNTELEAQIVVLKAALAAMELRIADGTRPPHPDYTVPAGSLLQEPPTGDGI